MRDYSRIITTIGSTPWLMTPEGVNLVMSIVNEHIRNGKMDEVELDARLAGRGRGGSSEPQVYRGVGILPIAGPIFGKANMMTSLSGATSLEMFQKEFAAMVNDDSIHTILLDVDSPGGTSEYVKETGDMIKQAKGVKPIYAISNSIAGSAAYWLASQANQVYVTPSGAVGSIGAYAVHTDQSGADAQDGIRYTITSAGPYKVEGNPHEPLSQEGKEFRQTVINELYDDFVSAVADGRGATTDQVKANMGGGRMYPPQMALDARMVDGVTTRDALIQQLANKPSNKSTRNHTGIPVSVMSEAFARASANGFTATEDIRIVIEDGNYFLESKEMEHSEPGSGSPPAPRKFGADGVTIEDGSDDPAIQGGWRRDPLPLPKDDPTAPQASAVVTTANINGGTTVDEAKVRSILKLDADASIEDALTTLVEAQATDPKVASVESLADSHPEFYAEHVRLLNKDRRTEGEKFAASVGTFSQQIGEVAKPTNFKMSALAQDEIANMHVLFAQGTATLEDFEKCITAISKGHVQLGAVGSSNGGDEFIIDTTSAVGIKNARDEFFMRVTEIQEKDKLEFKEALNLAATQYPDLFNAYRMAAPA